MATVFLMLLLSQDEALKPEKVWNGANWKGKYRPALIRTRADWERLWKEKGEPIPEVDFEKSWVLPIFRGGYGGELTLERLTAAPGGAVVVYFDPAKGLPIGKPFTHSAYLLVQLPRSAEKITLKVRWTGLPGSPMQEEIDPLLEWALRAKK